MLNLFSSSLSVLFQFLVLESPLFQVIFMKNCAENPLFEGLCYNLIIEIRALFENEF